MRPVGEPLGKAGRDRLRREPPEVHDLPLDPRERLLAAAGPARDVVERDRLTEDDRARLPVANRPPERRKAARNDRDSFDQRDRDGA